MLVNIFGKRSYRTTGSPNTHLPLYTAHPVSCKYSGDFSRVWLFGVVGSAAAGTDAFEVSVTLAFDRAALCGCVWANRGKSFAQKNPTNFVCFSILVILYIVCGADRERTSERLCVIKGSDQKLCTFDIDASGSTLIWLSVSCGVVSME